MAVGFRIWGLGPRISERFQLGIGPQGQLTALGKEWSLSSFHKDPNPTRERQSSPHEVSVYGNLQNGIPKLGKGPQWEIIGSPTS